jgi:hydrogenase/urease accessory protein HupE
LALVAVVAPGVADAHQSSFTFATIEADDDRTTVHYQIKLDSRDLFEALALDEDRDASDQEIMDGADRLTEYLTARLKFEADGESCNVEDSAVDIVTQNDRFARVALTVVCPRAIAELALDYDLFFDLDPLHVGLLTVEGEVVHLKKPDNSRFVWTLGEPPPSGTVGFIRSGVDHILFGLDHILFLFSLLLMALITRSTNGGWQPRPLRDGLLYTATIVTSFTIAHSVTLIGAALGWFELPGRLVESIIAASIVYVAIENVVRPDPPRRFVVTFVFGLIHGLGFASMLRPLLPPEQVVGPLLAFNVGVELGQLAIVVVLLPLLFGLTRLIGADRYRRFVLPTGAALLSAIGLIWLCERAFDITILGF